MPRKKSARDVADRILYEQVEHLKKKWDAFKGGDATSALTDIEEKFLLDVKKLEQEGDLAEAQSTYLERLNDQDLEVFYAKLEASLPAPEAQD